MIFQRQKKLVELLAIGFQPEGEINAVQVGDEQGLIAALDRIITDQRRLGQVNQWLLDQKSAALQRALVGYRHHPGGVAMQKKRTVHDPVQPLFFEYRQQVAVEPRFLQGHDVMAGGETLEVGG